MPSTNHNHQIPSSVHIRVDGFHLPPHPDSQVATGPLWDLLERLVARQGRTLVGMAVEAISMPCSDAPTAPPVPTATEPHAAPPVGVETTIAREAEAKAAVRGSIHKLTSHLETLALLATINEWPTVEMRWWDLLPELRSCVVRLAGLSEDGGDSLETVRIGQWTLGKHLDSLSGILREISACLGRTNSLELSDTLEQRLVPWLRQLDQILEQPQ